MSDISTLASSFWEFWGYVALVAVVVGVVRESIIEFTNVMKDETRSKQVAKASALLLIAGLAGELITQPNTNAASGQLIALLNKQTLQLQLDLEKERAARVPRTISPEQKAMIVQLLSPDRITKGSVLINSAMDGEAWQFGAQILGALKEAGFSVSEVPFGDRAIAFSIPGAFIQIKDLKHQPKHAGPIFEGFKRVGILLTAEEKAEIPDNDTVVIAISSHP
jgi:hypothetical protein